MADSDRERRGFEEDASAGIAAAARGANVDIVPGLAIGVHRFVAA